MSDAELDKSSATEQIQAGMHDANLRLAFPARDQVVVINDEQAEHHHMQIAASSPDQQVRR